MQDEAGGEGCTFCTQIKFEYLEKQLERRIELLAEKFQHQLHKTEAKIHSAVCQCMGELVKQQTPFRRKQDKLAAKQDLLLTIIVRDHCPLLEGLVGVLQ